MENSAQKENQQKYAKYVKEVTPTHSLPLNMAKAFLTGGLICMAGQFITNFAKNAGLDQEMAGTWCSVTLVFCQRHPYTALIFIPESGNSAVQAAWSQSPASPIP